MTTIARFREDCRGATAVLFGVMLLPIMVAAGTALDYTRAANVRTKMQAATDSAALAAARDAGDLSQSQLAARARGVFDANFHSRSATLDQFHAELNGKTVRISATASVPTVMLGILHIATINVGASSDVAWGRNKIELALVLDNTGSMAHAGKMTALKSAARDLISVLQGVATDRDSIKISIVPFDTQVNAGTGYRDASWLTYDGGLDRSLSTDRAHWRGCISDRAMPYDTQAGSQSGTNALYPAAQCEDLSLAELQPLTNDFAALRRTIDSMQPSGFTNITIGVAWGLASLSPSDPLGGGVAFGTPRVDKIMIVLTDGDNTRNRYTTSPSQIDARTSLACNSAKSAGVTIHTIRVMEGNVDLLRSCATSPANYHEVTDASQLQGVFRSIANEIANIRLTS